MKKKPSKKKISKIEYVTLHDIINIEKELLILYEKHRFNLTFGLLIKLNKALESIGEITNIYFKAIEEFSSIKALKQQNLDTTESFMTVEIYNEKLMNDKIPFSLTKYNELINDIQKYINIV